MTLNLQSQRIMILSKMTLSRMTHNKIILNLPIYRVSYLIYFLPCLMLQTVIFAMYHLAECWGAAEWRNSMPFNFYWRLLNKVFESQQVVMAKTIFVLFLLYFCSYPYLRHFWKFIQTHSYCSAKRASISRSKHPSFFWSQHSILAWSKYPFFASTNVLA